MREHYVFPKINVKYPPTPIKHKHHKIRTGGHPKLTWQQVCEIRKWHEKERLTIIECDKRARELNWPITQDKKKQCRFVRRILDYTNRRFK